jgi:hypothetical protein
MSETLLASLLAGMLGIVGSLGGMWLTQRHGLRLAREDRAEARRRELRTVLTGIITNAGMLVGGLGTAIASAQFMDQHRLKHTERLGTFEDEIELIQTALAQLPRDLTEAALLVGDDKLREHLQAMSHFFSKEGLALSLGSIGMLAEGHASPAAVEKHLKELVTLTEIVGRVEARASELLRVGL